ncbi:MAG: L,D-transpeptidase/peptidoglycan binding protein [Solirubrobacteraceae bacterium]|nr:L,D-transpeptidase/peptidoglycan binding protein [Solirubrobacteraceae bacterium]
MLLRVSHAVRALSVPVALAAALAASPIASAQDPAATPPPAPVVAAGVTVAGVDLSGLSAADATTKLEAARAQIQRDVVVQVGARKHKLSAGQALYSIDVPASVSAALAATAPGAATPVVKFSNDNVRAFVKKLADKEYRAPRDAVMKITPDRIRVTPHLVGRRVEVNPLAASISKALRDPVSSRFFIPKRAAVKAKVTRGTLKKKHWTILTVNRSTFKLRVFKGLKLSKTYPIAVGAAGHDTPSGTYSITNKAVNPTWHVPNSDWAGSLAGTTVPGGAPNNPLKARWLGIVDGVGIHGTSESWSIGSRASHGCLRMHVKDVIDLYPRVPVGTTVLIK